MLKKIHQKMSMPFASMIFTPLNIYLERLPVASYWDGLWVQLLWLAALALLSRLIWKSGLRAYAAQGG